MKSLQSVFDDLQESQKELKELNASYRDALLNSTTHEELKDEIKDLRVKKQALEYTIQAEMGSDYDRIEDLKLHIRELKDMMSDIAINQYAKGELEAIQDKYDNEYEPKISISFKKIS